MSAVSWSIRFVAWIVQTIFGYLNHPWFREPVIVWSSFFGSAKYLYSIIDLRLSEIFMVLWTFCGSFDSLWICWIISGSVSIILLYFLYEEFMNYPWFFEKFLVPYSICSSVNTILLLSTFEPFSVSSTLYYSLFCKSSLVSWTSYGSMFSLSFCKSFIAQRVINGKINHILFRELSTVPETIFCMVPWNIMIP